MTGIDMMHMLVQNELSEHKERRTSAIKAFVRDQYDIDTEVRFKQVELHNSLLDLFVDVPVRLEQPQMDKQQYQLYASIVNQHKNQIADAEDNSPQFEDVFSEQSQPGFRNPRDGFTIGAASFLLHPLVSRQLPRIVLEGAPGQGKSTIAQYLCQVHRMRILQKATDLASIPELHRNAPVCIPFKVDLRDLATWFSKHDPFSGDEASAVPTQWRKSLEAFLAAQVRHHSGGAEFDVDDLMAIVRLSSILLVLDGLDEVADIPRRQEVVEEISRGVSRLEENATALQVVVTSRPAAFANSPGLPHERFPHYQLASLTKPLIDEYTKRWTKARKLDNKEGSEVRKILTAKLDQTHLRDLARNPMQLAILLSLIHTRGSSLPDKRTALYDNYVDLFFSRESEKSGVVRDHRDLLIDIHGYLAWLLHSEAELGQNRGSISQDRLKELLKAYLNNEGHDVEVAELLFTGMVERVVALVSRVEGTFEFEVQPLREYFAARYLYETARYSPSGAEASGTKPDRFDALARNFYWLNVARFFAGRFDKGELSSLVDRLQDLVEDKDFTYTSHPRVLAATLLADWVFTQHPKSVKEVISLVMDGIGLRFILSTSSLRFGSGSPLILPPKCGSEDLISHCFSILSNSPTQDYALNIIQVIKANSSVENTKRLWLRYANSDTQNRSAWISYGLNLEVLPRLSLSELQELMNDAPLDLARLNVIFAGRCFDYCNHSETSFKAVLNGILDMDITAHGRRRVDSVLELVGCALDYRRYLYAHNLRSSESPSTFWKNESVFPAISRERIKYYPNYSEVSKCLELADIAAEEAEKPSREWATTIAPWDNIVEKSRAEWGEHWINYKFAVAASGIKSTKEQATDHPDMLDHSRSLCRRARYARLRSNSSSWWRKQFACVESEMDGMFVLLVFLTWATPTTLTQMIDEINSVLTSLSQRNWEKLAASDWGSWSIMRDYPGSEARLLSFDMDSLPLHLSPRTATALGIKAKRGIAKQLYARCQVSCHYEQWDCVE